jgi:hypothetical protein
VVNEDEETKKWKRMQINVSGKADDRNARNSPVFFDRSCAPSVGVALT